MLNYAINNGIINMDDILNHANDMKRDKIISNHPFEIWQASDGRWKTYLVDESKKNNRRLIAKSTREKLINAIVTDYEETNKTKNVLTFERVYHEWISSYVKTKEFEKSTADRYDCDFNKYYKGTEFAAKDISKITENDVIDFLKGIINVENEEDKIKRKAFVNIKSIISCTFKFAKTELRKPCIPISDTLSNLKFSGKKFKPHIVIDSEQVFNDEEVSKIGRYIAEEYKNTRQLGVLFALLTGVRVGELCTIKTTDIVNNVLYIKRTEVKEKDENGKTQIRIREFPKTEASISGIELSRSAIIVLSWIKKWNLRNNIQSDFLFYDNNYGRIKSRAFDKQIRKICIKLNIPVRSMHKLRKTYASHLFACQVEEKIVQSQLRHKDRSTTHKYYEFSTRNRDYKREQLNKADFLKDII